MQPPFELSLAPSVVAPGGWRLEQDQLGSFAGMDFCPEPAKPGDFAEAHQELSTSPSSGFVLVMVVARRTSTTSEVLRGCVLQTVGPDRAMTERDRLWDRVRSGHEVWVGAGRP